MGTRSLTFVYNDDQAVLNLYRQFDGYREGHGRDLAEFLDGFTIVNGFGLKDDRKIANGMGCLAAQLVAHFKQSVGGFYIHPVSETDCGQDYDYHITKNSIRVVGYGDEVFNGTWKEFFAWANAEHKEVA
jgi:hypothetical protein